MSRDYPKTRTPGEHGRWVARDKEEVVRQIILKKITAEEAMAQYEISEDELETWVLRYRQHGQEGLKATKVQLRPI